GASEAARPYPQLFQARWLSFSDHLLPGRQPWRRGAEPVGGGDSRRRPLAGRRRTDPSATRSRLQHSKEKKSASRRSIRCVPGVSRIVETQVERSTNFAGSRIFRTYQRVNSMLLRD